MKKLFAFFLLMLIILVVGCGNNKIPETKILSDDENLSNNTAEQSDSEQQPKEEEDAFEIKEKMFIAQCNDIYLNPNDYKDRAIKLEGMYDEYTDPETNKTYYSVLRRGPGCCGNDGVAGFEILYDGDVHPKINDWIEVVGKIELMEEDGSEYVVLRLSKMTVLEVRGAEFVSN